MKTRHDVLKHYFEYFNFLVFAVKVNNSGGPDAVSKCIGSYLEELNPRKRKFKAYHNGDEVLLRSCEEANKRGTIVSFVPGLSTLRFDRYKVRMWKSDEIKLFKHTQMAKWIDAYQILDVCRDFSASELRTKWIQKVRECHPDRGGTNQEMSDVARAYRILSDPRNRRLYDKGYDPQKLHIV